MDVTISNITTKDIEKNQLRITAKFKYIFPLENCELKIIVNDKKYTCNLDLNDKDGKERSYRLVLRKEVMESLNLTVEHSVKITKVDDYDFKLEKIDPYKRTKEQDDFIKKFMIK